MQGLLAPGQLASQNGQLLRHHASRCFWPATDANHDLDGREYAIQQTRLPNDAHVEGWRGGVEDELQGTELLIFAPKKQL